MLTTLDWNITDFLANSIGSYLLIYHFYGNNNIIKIQSKKKKKIYPIPGQDILTQLIRYLPYQLNDSLAQL